MSCHSPIALNKSFISIVERPRVALFLHPTTGWVSSKKYFFYLTSLVPNCSPQHLELESERRAIARVAD